MQIGVMLIGFLKVGAGVNVRVNCCWLDLIATDYFMFGIIFAIFQI